MGDCPYGQAFCLFACLACLNKQRSNNIECWWFLIPLNNKLRKGSIVNINHFLAVALLSANSAAVFADVNELARVTAEGTVKVNANSDLQVTFKEVSGLTVDDIKKGSATKVLSFTPRASSGLIASAFTNPVGTGHCTNAEGSSSGNTIEVCIDSTTVNKAPILIGSQYFIEGDSGLEYHLFAGDGNKSKDVNPDSYKVSLQFVNFTK